MPFPYFRKQKSLHFIAAFGFLFAISLVLMQQAGAQLVVDLTPPTATANFAPPPSGSPATVNAGSVDLTFTCSDTETGCAAIDYSIHYKDGTGVERPVTSPETGILTIIPPSPPNIAVTTSPAITITRDTTYPNMTIEYQAADAAGNTQALQTETFVFDIAGEPWCSCIGGDCRFEAGLSCPIPVIYPPPSGGGECTAANNRGDYCACTANGDCASNTCSNNVCIQTGACWGPYASIPSASSNTPGIVYDNDDPVDLGGGQASPDPYNWAVGGDAFTSVNPGIVRTSYEYMSTTVRQSGITPTSMDDPAVCSGGITDCQLDSALERGVYTSDGPLTVLIGSGTPTHFTFPAGKNFVFLIDGDLRIETEIEVPTSSTVTFSVSGDITVAQDVGYAANVCPTNLGTTQLQGFYSADGSIILEGVDDCSVGPDKMLGIDGTFVVNAGLSGGTMQNNRTLCTANLTHPTFFMRSRPDFLLHAPDFIRSPNYVWQEVAP